jgi:WD40 repeat protein
MDGTMKRGRVDGDTDAATASRDVGDRPDMNAANAVKAVVPPQYQAPAVRGDEQWLVIEGDNATVQFWDATTCFHVKSLQLENVVHWFEFSPDNRLLAIAFDGTIDFNTQLWDVASFELVWEIPGSWGAFVCFNRQMTRMAVKRRSGHDYPDLREEIVTWDFISRSVMHSFEFRAVHTETLHFDESGAFLLDVGFSADTHKQSLLITWDTETGAQLHQFDVGHSTDFNDGISCTAMCPSGDMVATGSGDYRAVVVDLNQWTQRACLTAHTHCVFSVLFSADGGRLVTGSLDGLIIVWSTESWLEMLRINVHRPVLITAISPDANRIACLGEVYQEDDPYFAADTRIPQVYDAWTGKFLCSVIHAVNPPARNHAGDRICYSNSQLSILM